MAAGLGFKDFTTGEVLTAADVDGYLMQGVWVFASATARDAAVTSPQEGNFAYLKDTNVTTYYTGSAWANLDTTGMTNPMTTTGDTIYSSSGSTPARLGIGTAGQVLQVNSGATAPEWATPAGGGGMTLISTTTLSGASVTLSTIPQTYKSLYLVIRSYKPANDNATLKMRFNSSSTASTYYNLEYSTAGDFGGNGRTYDDTSLDLALNQDSTIGEGLFTLEIPDYANASTRKWVKMDCIAIYDTSTLAAFGGIGAWKDTSAVSSLYFFPGSGNFTSGTILLYGVS